VEVEGKSKLKLLYLLDILEKESDDEHKLTMKDIIERLEKRGITAERKSVSRDIKLLCEYGYDIVSFGENREGYFMASRKFNVPELRLLMDAVLSARFISLKQSKELIQKLKTLTSNNLAKKLGNQLYIDEKIKTSNDFVYENVDRINEAINLNKKIAFKYYSYTLDKQFVANKGGQEYIRSPYSLAWYDDKYYMICGHDKYEDLSHFRVDRMRHIRILKEDRRNFNEVSNYKNGFDTADYVNSVFNMFTGTEETIKIKFHKDLINVVIEKFGEEVSLIKLDEEHFEIRATVKISEGFFAWVLQFGYKAEVIYPEKVREEMKRYVGEMNKLYQGE
jgi:predicted DNA-binding transcriptional regulator YafY